jgi:hypothetical protein
MLTDDELAQLAEDLLDLIEDRAADILGVPATQLAEIPKRQLLTAALEVDAGLREVTGGVSRLLDERARAAGLTYEQIGRARGKTRQAAHSAARRRTALTG